MKHNVFAHLYKKQAKARKTISKPLPERLEPTIGEIRRENGNYVVYLKEFDDWMTYTEDELIRNFPRQYGGE